MLQTLSGDCYELPSRLPRKVEAVWEWWWKELKTNHIYGVDDMYEIWPCQVKVTDVTEMKQSKTRHYFAMIVDKTVRLRSYGTDYLKLYSDSLLYLRFVSLNNESIIAYVCSIPPEQCRCFPRQFLSHPHPRIVEWILAATAIDDSFAASAMFELARNPDSRVIEVVRRARDTYSEVRSVHHDFRRGVYYNTSPEWKPYFLSMLSTLSTREMTNHFSRLFASTDPEILAHVWEKIIHHTRYDMFWMLPVNNEPTAISLILRDFDRFRLHVFPFVYNCSHPEVLQRCVAKWRDHTDHTHHTHSLDNPSDVIVDWLMEKAAAETWNMEHHLYMSALNTNDRVVEWQLANPPKRRNDRYWKLIRNPHPRVTDWVCTKMEKLSVDSVREIIEHTKESGAPLPARVMAELIHRHGMGDDIPTMMALSSFVAAEDVTLMFVDT